MVIWCADANGQICKIKQEDKPRKIFGPYRKQEIAEKGNGKNKQHMLPRKHDTNAQMETSGTDQRRKRTNKN